MIGKIASYAKSKSDSFEAYYVESEDLNADIRKNNVSFLSSGSSIGFSIRVVKDGRLGISYTNDVKKYKECIERALKIARLSRKDRSFSSFARKTKIGKVKNFSRKLLEFDDIASFSKQFIENLHEVESSISLSEGSYIKDMKRISIVNSEGVDIRMRELHNAFSYILSVKKGESYQMADGEAFSRDVIKPDIAKEGAERIISLLDKKKCRAGTLQAIFRPQAISALFNNSFSFAIDAEHVHQKKSLFTGKIGKEVMDKKLSFSDDATMPMLINTREADDEGTASRKTAVVNKGVLKSFLYDTYYGNLLGHKSTGNAFRNVTSPPGISTTNLLFEGKGKDDVVKEVDSGLIINRLLGIHTMNTATGDFSLAVDEGHYIENGEIMHAVKDTMVAGNFFELLKEVSAVGNDFDWLGSGTYMPSIMFPKIKVI